MTDDAAAGQFYASDHNWKVMVRIFKFKAPENSANYRLTSHEMQNRKNALTGIYIDPYDLEVPNEYGASVTEKTNKSYELNVCKFF